MSVFETSRKAPSNADLHMVRLREARRALVAGRGCRCLAAVMVLAGGATHAQEALQSSQAGEAAAAARRRQQQSQLYTVKWGDFRMRVEPSLAIEWNDNINLSHEDAQQSFILKPLLQLRGNYPLSELNVLNLSVGVGYDEYIGHEDYSRWRLQQGSELSFDLFIKDLRITLYDRFRYTQDSATQAAAAGNGYYGGLFNTAGLSATWDLKDLVLTAGYDHFNFISSSSQYEYLNRASEMPVLRAGVKLHPTVTAGVEGTVSLTMYDQHYLNDSVSYSGGVYADWQPGEHFHLQSRFGYVIYDFEQTSDFIEAVDQNAWYIGLTASHQVNESVSYSLSAGHELELGINADTLENWYVRPSITLRVIKDVPLTADLSYEHGTQGLGNLAERYDWLGFGLGARYQLMKKLMLGANYRLTLRSSSYTFRSYNQNLVGLNLTYQF